MADAVKQSLGPNQWLYVAPDASVSVVETAGLVPLSRYRGRSLIASLADAYDDLHDAHSSSRPATAP